jgi:hypothetical protein
MHVRFEAYACTFSGFAVAVCCLDSGVATYGINVEMDPEDQLKVRQLSVLVFAIVQPKHGFSTTFCCQHVSNNMFCVAAGDGGDL